MLEKTSKKQRRKKEAILSGNLNRILWIFDRASAYRLFCHSLNAVTASQKTEDELLALRGIGPETVASIRELFRK